MCSGETPERRNYETLRDVEAERDRRKFDEAKRLSNYSFQKRQEYIDLLAPYDGKTGLLF